MWELSAKPNLTGWAFPENFLSRASASRRLRAYFFYRFLADRLAGRAFWVAPAIGPIRALNVASLHLGHGIPRETRPSRSQVASPAGPAAANTVGHDHRAESCNPGESSFV